MPAYMVNIEHLETDQVFSVWHDDTLMHFNATLLARLRDQMPSEFERITLDLSETEYKLCMEHRGIEEDKVAALKPKSLREPGYAVFWDNGLFTIVDGHHRLVRRYRGGVRVMDFWVTTRQVWEHCLVRYEPEGDEIIAKSLPERVQDPGLVMSSVTWRPGKSK